MRQNVSILPIKMNTYMLFKMEIKLRLSLIGGIFVYQPRVTLDLSTGSRISLCCRLIFKVLKEEYLGCEQVYPQVVGSKRMFS